MKKSEMARQGLECCTMKHADCSKCPYYGGVGDLSCINALLKDVHDSLVAELDRLAAEKGAEKDD